MPIAFKSTSSKSVGASDYEAAGVLSIRGVSRPVVLDVHYLGRWRTPYWTAAGDAGPITRVGFAGEARINRHDFQVSWNGRLESGGVVVSDEITINLDVEALLKRLRRCTHFLAAGHEVAIETNHGKEKSALMNGKVGCKTRTIVVSVVTNSHFSCSARAT